jgi:hypothetical protein
VSWWNREWFDRHELGLLLIEACRWELHYPFTPTQASNPILDLVVI